MLKKRVIPILLLKDGWIVQSKGFNEYRKLGNAFSSVKRLSQWDADELIYLIIGNNDAAPTQRTDLANKGQSSIRELLQEVSINSRMPITIGGNIRTLEDIELRLRYGADKVALNTSALNDPNFVKTASREFGRQCVVISIDYLKGRVFNRNIPNTDIKLMDWVSQVQDFGAGEILLNSVERDGQKTGYDVETIQAVKDAVDVPVIACGGAGKWEDMIQVLIETEVDAVAAANIFHFQDQSVYYARKSIFDAGLNVRPPSVSD